jgi:hypothetical protein
MANVETNTSLGPGEVRIFTMTVPQARLRAGLPHESTLKSETL